MDLGLKHIHQHQVFQDLEDNSYSIRGYIITEINGTEIDTASEAVELLDGLSRNGYRLKVEMIDLNGEVSAYFF